MIQRLNLKFEIVENCDFMKFEYNRPTHEKNLFVDFLFFFTVWGHRKKPTTIKLLKRAREIVILFTVTVVKKYGYVGR